MSCNSNLGNNWWIILLVILVVLWGGNGYGCQNGGCGC